MKSAAFVTIWKSYRFAGGTPPFNSIGTRYWPLAEIFHFQIFDFWFFVFWISHKTVWNELDFVRVVLLFCLYSEYCE